MAKNKKENNDIDYKKLLNLLIVCTDVNDLDQAIKTFYNFYTKNNISIPKKLSKIVGLSEEEKLKNLLKIIETGIGEKGLENVYDKLFAFYMKKNLFPTMNNIERVIIFDDLLHISNLATGVYKSFVDLNLYINSKGISNPINFDNVLIDLNRLLKVLRKAKSLLLDSKLINDNLYVSTLDFIIFFEDLLNVEIDLTQKLLMKSKGGKYGYFQYIKDSKKRNDANVKVGECFDRLKIEEINKISYNIFLDSLKVAKDIEEFLKIFGLEEETKKYKKSFVETIVYMCIYFNGLALLKSNKYDKETIKVISASVVDLFSKQNNNDFEGNLKKFAYIKTNLDNLPDNTKFKDCDIYLLACEIFFIWAFNTQLDIENLSDTEYYNLLLNLRNTFSNIVEQKNIDL